MERGVVGSGARMPGSGRSGALTHVGVLAGSRGSVCVPVYRSSCVGRTATASAIVDTLTHGWVFVVTCCLGRTPALAGRRPASDSCSLVTADAVIRSTCTLAVAQGNTFLSACRVPSGCALQGAPLRVSAAHASGGAQLAGGAQAPRRTTICPSAPLRVHAHVHLRSGGWGMGWHDHGRRGSAGPTKHMSAVPSFGSARPGQAGWPDNRFACAVDVVPDCLHAQRASNPSLSPARPTGRASITRLEHGQRASLNGSSPHDSASTDACSPHAASLCPSGWRASNHRFTPPSAPKERAACAQPAPFRAEAHARRMGMPRPPACPCEARVPPEGVCPSAWRAAKHSACTRQGEGGTRKACIYLPLDAQPLSVPQGATARLTTSTPPACRVPSGCALQGGVHLKLLLRWAATPLHPPTCTPSSVHETRPVRPARTRPPAPSLPAHPSRASTSGRFAREACAPKGCVHPLLPPRPCLGRGCDHRPGVSPGVSASATVSRAWGITPAGSPRRAGPPSKGRGQALLAPLHITGSQSAVLDMYEPERRGPGRSRTHRAWRAAQARPTGRRALLLAYPRNGGRSAAVTKCAEKRAAASLEAGSRSPGAAKTQTRAGHRRSADKGVKET